MLNNSDRPNFNQITQNEVDLYFANGNPDFEQKNKQSNEQAAEQPLTPN